MDLSTCDNWVLSFPIHTDSRQVSEISDEVLTIENFPLESIDTGPQIDLLGLEWLWSKEPMSYWH